MIKNSLEPTLCCCFSLFFNILLLFQFSHNCFFLPQIGFFFEKWFFSSKIDFYLQNRRWVPKISKHSLKNHKFCYFPYNYHFFVQRFYSDLWRRKQKLNGNKTTHTRLKVNAKYGIQRSQKFKLRSLKTLRYTQPHCSTFQFKLVRFLRRVTVSNAPLALLLIGIKAYRKESRLRACCVLAHKQTLYNTVHSAHLYTCMLLVIVAVTPSKIDDQHIYNYATSIRVPFFRFVNTKWFQWFFVCFFSRLYICVLLNEYRKCIHAAGNGNRYEAK